MKSWSQISQAILSNFQANETRVHVTYLHCNLWRGVCEKSEVSYLHFKCDDFYSSSVSHLQSAYNEGQIKRLLQSTLEHPDRTCSSHVPMRIWFTVSYFMIDK